MEDILRTSPPVLRIDPALHKIILSKFSPDKSPTKLASNDSAGRQQAQKKTSHTDLLECLFSPPRDPKNDDEILDFLSAVRRRQQARAEEVVRRTELTNKKTDEEGEKRLAAWKEEERLTREEVEKKAQERVKDSRRRSEEWSVSIERQKKDILELLEKDRKVQEQQELQQQKQQQEFLQQKQLQQQKQQQELKQKQQQELLQQKQQQELLQQKQLQQQKQQQELEQQKQQQELQKQKQQELLQLQQQQELLQLQQQQELLQQQQQKQQLQPQQVKTFQQPHQLQQQQLPKQQQLQQQQIQQPQPLPQQSLFQQPQPQQVAKQAQPQQTQPQQSLFQQPQPQQVAKQPQPQQPQPQQSLFQQPQPQQQPQQQSLFQQPQPQQVAKQPQPQQSLFQQPQPQQQQPQQSLFQQPQPQQVAKQPQAQQSLFQQPQPLQVAKQPQPQQRPPIPPQVAKQQPSIFQQPQPQPVQQQQAQKSHPVSISLEKEFNDCKKVVDELNELRMKNSERAAVIRSAFSCMIGQLSNQENRVEFQRQINKIRGFLAGQFEVPVLMPNIKSTKIKPQETRLMQAVLFKFVLEECGAKLMSSVGEARYLASMIITVTKDEQVAVDFLRFICFYCPILLPYFPPADAYDSVESFNTANGRRDNFTYDFPTQRMDSILNLYLAVLLGKADLPHVKAAALGAHNLWRMLAGLANQASVLTDRYPFATEVVVRVLFSTGTHLGQLYGAQFHKLCAALQSGVEAVPPAKADLAALYRALGLARRGPQ